MLKSIEITNSSGISETVKLNFLKGKYSYREEYIYNEVISPALIYGRNSSGKTSVLKTILNIINIFKADITDNAYYAMDNMFFDDNITKIKLEFELKGNNYMYEVHIIDKNIINYESVSINDILSYVRDENSIEIHSPSEDVEEFMKSAIMSKEFEIGNQRMSFIRHLGKNDVCDELTDIYNYFKSFNFVATNKNISSVGNDNSLGELLVKFNEDYSNYLESMTDIMNLKFKVVKEFVGERIIAIYEKKNVQYEFDFETMISSGTKDLYSTLALMLSLEPGSLLVIDEIEKTFHPELLDVLVKEIIAKLDIQVICSSHNTHLLQSLRPDQIFFTKKENEIVRVDRLSEIYPGIREIHNIEKLYLGKRFE